MSIRKVFYSILALAAAFAASGAVDPTNYTLNEPKIFTAAAGETNVYSGIISGTSYAIVEGGGTVAFSNPNNTYTGGTLVSNAVFRLDADGCAGTGAITGAINTAHVFINCENVPNDLRFLSGPYNTSYMKPGAYPASGQNLLFPLQSSVTIEGSVSFASFGMLYDSTSPAMVSPLPTVRYKKGISVENSYLYLCPQGRMIFEGQYKGTAPTYANNVGLGYKYNAYGTMEFHASSNVAYRVSLYDADLDFRAVDAFPETLFYYENCGNDYCKMLLNGNDQTILGVCMKSSLTPGETAKGMCITSDAPATVRIIGCAMNRVAGSLVNRVALFGKVTLVMDVNSTYTDASFYQDFSVRKSTTTGDLIISNGDFRVTGGASFPNVPNIYVGTGGTFSSGATTNAFAGCTNLVLDGTMTFADDVKTPFAFGTMALSLGASAHLTLPLGSTVTVLSLKVGDDFMPEGAYGDGGIPVDQILQGTVVVRSHDRYVDCNTTDTVNDGSMAHPHKTIKAATDNAISGDVIHVAPGTYADAEGTQPATSRIAARVVVPAGVTLESTGGATNTFIVGALATGDQIDDATYSTGTNGIRCVYAKSGAVVRGFTLTGGRGVGSGDDSNNGLGAAFLSATARTAKLEDCIVSNNAAYGGPIYQAVVKRCRVLCNTGLYMASAGYSCGWYNCIIDKNRGNGTVRAAYAFENCTIGANNVINDTTGNPQVLYWYDAGDHAVINSVVLGGRYYAAGGAKLYCTNCLVMANQIGSNLKVEQSYNTIFTNSAAMKVDEDYRPILGKFAGIDKGDASVASDALGNTDIYKAPRILNGAIDIGAVEYDWRPTFNAEIGRRFTMTYASPTVTTNATGGVKLDGDVGTLGERALPVCVAGTVTSAGPYEFRFEMTGGSAQVYVGGVLAGEASGTGAQAIRIEVPDITSEIRFTFTPDEQDPGAAILRKFAGARGFSVTIR